MEAAALEGGFADAVFDAQRVFRALMDAMSEPGTIRPISTRAAPPAPLSASAGALALAVCDHDTPVFLAPGLDTPSVRSWLAYQTGASIVDAADAAAFAFLAHGDALSLENFAIGTDAYPDRSATLVIDGAALGSGRSWRLAGPGIEGDRTFATEALPEGFAEAWARNNALFPCGIDLVIAGDGAIAALPRTTRVERES